MVACPLNTCVYYYNIRTESKRKDVLDIVVTLLEPTMLYLYQYSTLRKTTYIGKYGIQKS